MKSSRKLNKGSKKQSYQVELEIPKGCTTEDIRLYIKEAVETWCKTTDPDGALFDLNDKSVKVRTIK
jgi:hypothetical protein